MADKCEVLSLFFSSLFFFFFFFFGKTRFSLLFSFFSGKKEEANLQT